MRFDLADLSLFRHIVEAGSITHGAERAHLALAAASTRIRNMEESLGAPLLVRRRQGVSPTVEEKEKPRRARNPLPESTKLLPPKFLAAAEKCQPVIVGMSALLTTTMTYMKTVIDGFDKAGKGHIKMAGGGAPISQM